MTESKVNAATFIAHSVVLMALVASHPDRDALRLAISQQMQQALDVHAQDPEISGILTSFEEVLRRIIGQ